jgi:hypothetical protein
MTARRHLEEAATCRAGSARESPRCPLPEPTTSMDALPEYFPSVRPTPPVRSSALMLTGNSCLARAGRLAGACHRPRGLIHGLGSAIQRSSTRCRIVNGSLARSAARPTPPPPGFGRNHWWLQQLAWFSWPVFLSSGRFCWVVGGWRTCPGRNCLGPDRAAAAAWVVRPSEVGSRSRRCLHRR